MEDATEEPLASESLMALAQSILMSPENPAAEIAYLALLLAQVGWNRAIVGRRADVGVPHLDRVFARDPELWRHFRVRGVRNAIAELASTKRALYPNDRRVITGCQMSSAGKVRVEWAQDDE